MDMKKPPAWRVRLAAAMRAAGAEDDRALAAGHGLGASGSSDEPAEPEVAAGPLGELWIDEDGALAKHAARVPEDLRLPFAQFVASGYTIFPAAVPATVVDQLVTDTRAYCDRPREFVLKYQGAYIDPERHAALRKGDRIVDIYAVSAAARAAVYPASILRFLQILFADDPIAMQSISFEYGSQQSMHQDTAYVVSERPLSLAATWLALEDIEAGSGELMYYPGSHRFAHFLFSGQHKSWMRSRDGDAAHSAFLAQLHLQARDRGIREERFVARKGDVLVWHADLAHGGSPIRIEGRTRRSLVTHFCPRSVKPAYRRLVPAKYVEFEHVPGGFFTSRHYDLGQMHDGRAVLMYDGGVSKRREQPSV